MKSPYYAHSGKDNSLARSDWQLLAEHLISVARGAAERAISMKSLPPSFVSLAHATGLCHDVGKYRRGFQEMLLNLPVPRKSTYHKGAGAAAAWSSKAYASAFAIAGHHGGFPDLAGLKDSLQDDSYSPAASEIWPEAIIDCVELKDLVWDSEPARVRMLSEQETRLLFDLETRLLFSCLVDADWADTAEHDRRVQGWEQDLAPPLLNHARAEIWLESVLAMIREKAEKCGQSIVAEARDAVLQAALKTAEESSPGFFSLTVPTGGGKTLSGLAFALKHAARHELRRIIYVAPFLTILDQNARAIRDALRIPPEGLEVFEHHSLAEPSGEPRSNNAADSEADLSEGTVQDEARRAAASRRAENWDASVIITTNVQFFESLFSNQPGRCRKLHNIARSVIVLDECQSIPADLLAPTCSMLAQLVKHLGCTVVLATATQPTFNHRELVDKGCGLLDVREIVPKEVDLFNKLRRVHIEWPNPGEYLDWDEVAGLMTEDKRKGRRAALCVVNTRRAARELYEALDKIRPGDTFHLSTWMCPKHRLNVLDEIKARLKNKLSCYVVSTQLIEAGVDVDFPLVLREIGPFEAIIQAAGRSNREGTLNQSDGSPGGRVIVFRSLAAKDHPERYYPHDPWYVRGRDILENNFLGKGRRPQCDDPAVIEEYYTRLFNSGELDRRNKEGHTIQQLRAKRHFKEISSLYRLIEAEGQPVIVATWSDPDSRMTEIADLIKAVRERPTRKRFRQLAPFQVNLRFPTDRQLSFVEEGPHGVLIWRGGYDKKLGLWDELLVDQCVY